MLRSIVSNWAALISLGLLSFLMTPFMIHRLGDLQFGLYTLAFSVVGFSEFIEMGIRSTLQRFVGRLSGIKDREGLNAVFSTAVALTVTIGVVVIAFSWGLSGFLAAFFKLRSLDRSTFSWLVILLGLNVGAGLPAMLLQAYLSGLQRFDLQNLIAIIRQGLRSGLIVVVLLLGKGIIAVAGCALAGMVAVVPLNWWMLRRSDPGLRFSPHLANRTTARELLGFSFWTLLNNAGQFLRDSTDSVVIGRVLGSALITPFTVASRLVDYFRPVIIGMVSPLLPRVSELEGQSRHNEIRQLFLRMTRLSALASLGVGSMLLLHGRTILLLWVGGRFVSSYGVLVLLTLGGVASLAQFGTLHTLIALGRHRAYGIWTLGEGAANLILSVIWARRYGIVGVALGTAVPLLAVKLTLQPLYVSRVLGMPAIQYLRKALARPLAACTLFLGLCGPLCGFQANGSVWHVVGALAWQGALFLALALFLGLDRGDRKLLGERVKLVMRLVPAF